MRRIILTVVLSCLIGVGIIFAAVSQPPSVTQFGRAAAQWLPTRSKNTLGSFLSVKQPMPLSFPKDFGAHEGYQTEWWYYTGNLSATSGKDFGYELTIFRRALTPQESAQSAQRSHWHSNQVYFAHFTVSDIAHQAFYPSERFSRGALGLAGAQASPYRIWLEDWTIAETKPGEVHLTAKTDQASINLVLNQPLPPILQGDRGYSKKGPEPGNASYYYSIVQQPTQGTLIVGDKVYSVQGKSWTDHEYSTSALSEGTQGWDWFSLQLENGSSLMLYGLRYQDGTIAPESSGTFIAADGKTNRLTKDDWQLEVLKTWKSPTTGAEYPAFWKIQIPKLALTFTLEPDMPNQELNLSTTYWEGAVHLTGQQSQQPITGRGYVEMTGYERRLRV